MTHHTTQTRHTKCCMPTRMTTPIEQHWQVCYLFTLTASKSHIYIYFSKSTMTQQHVMTQRHTGVMEGIGLAPNDTKCRLDLGMLFFMYFFICTYIYIIGNLQQHNGTVTTLND